MVRDAGWGGGEGGAGKGVQGTGTAGEWARWSAVCLGTWRRPVWLEHSVGRVERHTLRPADAPEQTWQEFKLVILPFSFGFFLMER